jgi:hypothetical protein
MDKYHAKTVLRFIVSSFSVTEESTFHFVQGVHIHVSSARTEVFTISKNFAVFSALMFAVSAIVYRGSVCKSRKGNERKFHAFKYTIMLKIMITNFDKMNADLN